MISPRVMGTPGEIGDYRRVFARTRSREGRQRLHGASRDVVEDARASSPVAQCPLGRGRASPGDLPSRGGRCSRGRRCSGGRGGSRRRCGRVGAGRDAAAAVGTEIAIGPGEVAERRLRVGRSRARRSPDRPSCRARSCGSGCDCRCDGLPPSRAPGSRGAPDRRRRGHRRRRSRSRRNGARTSRRPASRRGNGPLSKLSVRRRAGRRPDAGAAGGIARG